MSWGWDKWNVWPKVTLLVTNRQGQPMQEEHPRAVQLLSPNPFPLSPAASQEVFHNYPHVDEETCGQQEWNAQGHMAGK